MAGRLWLAVALALALGCGIKGPPRPPVPPPVPRDALSAGAPDGGAP